MQSIDYISIGIQFLVAVGFVATAMLVTHNNGTGRKTKDKLESFECGIDSQGNARLPFSIKYFLTAILFVLFDVEVIFMYPWAVNFRELGSTGFTEMLLFVGTLLIGFFYIIKKGALKWEPSALVDKRAPSVAAQQVPVGGNAIIQTPQN
jgi:NADH-quinone oxidoreductase subunit A